MRYILNVCGWNYGRALSHPVGCILPTNKWEDVSVEMLRPLYQLS